MPELSPHIPLRRRSLVSKIFYAPRVFRSHYRVFRVFGRGRVEAVIISWRLMCNIFHNPKVAA